MKRLLSLCLFTMCASVALAEPPRVDIQAATALVEKELVAPRGRSEKKRKIFSRAAPVPLTRRVRVLDEVSTLDARGKAYVRFAVDQRLAFDDASAWNEAVFEGCVYVETREVYVREDEAYYPAKRALGADVKPRTGVCQPPVVSASAFPALAP